MLSKLSIIQRQMINRVDDGNGVILVNVIKKHYHLPDTSNERSKKKCDLDPYKIQLHSNFVNQCLKAVQWQALSTKTIPIKNRDTNQIRTNFIPQTTRHVLAKMNQNLHKNSNKTTSSQSTPMWVLNHTESKPVFFL